MLVDSVKSEKHRVYFAKYRISFASGSNYDDRTRKASEISLKESDAYKLNSIFLCQIKLIFIFTK